MTDFRRWAAGLIGELSVWLQNRLYPNYTERVLRERAGEKAAHQWRTDCAVYVSGPVGDAMAALERMESRGWNN